MDATHADQDAAAQQHLLLRPSAHQTIQPLDTVAEDGDILELDATEVDDADDADDPDDDDDGSLTPRRNSYTTPTTTTTTTTTTRFYRPSATRRRGSAASSRRNSISSVHSRCSSRSHLSGLDGQQSKLVAQHLRRASFLADRQARLADRAAHAEKVRLRAALAKSVQARDASVSAERALAAQQARERNLAEITATCAEEVKKAKTVAETMRGRREQELASLRAQIEERHAEAERRRREELRNRCTKRSRAHSTTIQQRSTPSPRRILSQEEAAARISWWWASLVRRRTVARWNRLGLSVDSVRTMSFDAVTQMLVEDRVVKTAAAVLRICGLGEGEPGAVGDMAVARVFLGAFLILGHPEDVFDDEEGDSQAERDLVAKARDQLISFENILSHLSPTNNYTAPPSQHNHCAAAYTNFHKAFIAWKSRSKTAMIDMMLEQFVELDAIWLSVKDCPYPDVRESYAEVKENQIQILVRLKRLVGDRAKKLISDAVKKARRDRAAKSKGGDTRPRAVVEKNEIKKDEDDEKPPTLSPLGSLLPDNRVMVHELAIDDEYTIPTDEFCRHQALQQAALVTHMRVTADQSQEETFFDVFKLLARNIKDKLQRIVPSGGRMHALMDDLLDLDVAERQFRVGSFSYDKYFGAVTSILPQLCAPARDDQLGALVEFISLRKGSLMDRAEALLGFVDTMLCDYVNHLLRQAAPGLIASAPAYEARQFSDLFGEPGCRLLPVAEAAWSVARARVEAEASRRDPEGVNLPRSRPTGDRIYYEMLVDLFTQPAATVPEMLRLDAARIARAATTVHHIAVAGAILVQCKNLLKRDVRTPWKAEATRIMTVLEKSGQTHDQALVGVMAALEAGRAMPDVTREQLRSLAGRALSCLGSAPTEPVVRLLLGRVRTHLLARVLAGTSSASTTDRVRESSSAAERMVRSGLGEYVDKVRMVAEMVVRVAGVDRAAHAGWWEAVAGRDL